MAERAQAAVSVQAGAGSAAQHPAASISSALSGDLPREKMCNDLQMAESIAGILAFNFLGDGCFDKPAEAPGVGPMVQAVADLLVQAEAAAAQANIAAPGIAHASGFAQHLAAQSQEGSPYSPGFRIGDQWVGMCYWTIEQMVKRVHEEHAV